MKTRAGVRVLVLVAVEIFALALAFQSPVPIARAQAAFYPVPNGCDVAPGLSNTTLIHYTQGDSAGNYTGPNDTGSYLSFICNFGARRGGTDRAGMAISVDYCGDPPPAANSRETGEYNTYDGEHTVFYKRWLRIGNVTIRLAVYTDPRGGGQDQFTAAEFDQLAMNLMNRNTPDTTPCGPPPGPGPGPGTWNGTVSLATDKNETEPNLGITLTATAAPSLQGTNLRLVIGEIIGANVALIKDCGAASVCVSLVTSPVPAEAKVQAFVLNGNTLVAQSVNQPILKWALMNDWEGTMGFFIGVTQRPGQGVKSINVKPNVAVPLAVVLSEPLDDTPSQILIFDGNALMAACTSGWDCFATVNSSGPAVKTYTAQVSRADGSKVRASSTVTVTWSNSGSGEACGQGWQHKVVSIDGPLSGARLRDAGGDDLGPVTVGQKVCPHQYIVTGAGTTVRVNMPGVQSGRLDSWEVTVQPGSEVNIQIYNVQILGVDGIRIDVEIIDGKTRARSIDSRETDITMHGGVGRAGSRGTDFEVAYDRATGTMTVTVYESNVEVTHDKSSIAPVTVRPGEKATVTANAITAPVKLTEGLSYKLRLPQVTRNP